jgi:hypothetical protein
VSYCPPPESYCPPPESYCPPPAVSYEFRYYSGRGYYGHHHRRW